MNRLKNKTILVTAAGQGIGRQTAEAFVKEQANVIATDINPDLLKGLDSCECRQLDVTDVVAIKAIIADLGSIDVLFNCAGIVHSGSILDCNSKDWDAAFNINVRSMYLLIQAVLPVMMEQNQGSIINMASVASSLKGVQNRFAYSASKAAILGLTKSVAADFVSHQIRCNAICPGTVDSPSLHDRLRAMGDYDEALSTFKARQPMGRLGKTEEIAQLAVYLASDESAFTTGQSFVIDGGWTN